MNQRCSWFARFSCRKVWTPSYPKSASKRIEAIQENGFPGSPTVRINGRDIEEDIGLAGLAGLSCRTYRENHVMRKLPGRALILRALREAAEDSE